MEESYLWEAVELYSHKIPKRNGGVNDGEDEAASGRRDTKGFPIKAAHGWLLGAAC